MLIRRELTLHAVIFVVAYVSVAWFGIHVWFSHENLVLIQPFPAIALTIVVFFGYRFWPGILLGSFVGNLSQDAPLEFALVRAIGFSLVAEFGAYALRHSIAVRNSFDSLRSVFGFLIVAPLLTACLGALFGATAFVLSGLAPLSAFLSAWQMCWLSAAMGLLLITPALLAVPRVKSINWTQWKCVEAVALIVLVIALSTAVFRPNLFFNLPPFPLAFLPLPLLYWAGVRFGQLGASTSALLAVYVMAWGTSHGLGPFANHPQSQTLILMATYTVVAAVGPMLVAVVVDDLTATRARLNKLSHELESKVEERTAELVTSNAHLKKTLERQTSTERHLATTNSELESFAYSVSHDLRAPLRHVAGFSNAMLEDYSDRLDDTGCDLLRRIDEATCTMSRLIDDLLTLSRLSRQEMNVTRVNLSELAKSIACELQESSPERNVRWVIADGLTCDGDPGLINVLTFNLLENAWKYTSREPLSVIEVGQVTSHGTNSFFVRDNGVGFDMAFAKNLFAPFYRLHNRHEFPGTGIGLTTVKRIVARHEGSVWIESAVGEGTSVYFRFDQAEVIDSGQYDRSSGSELSKQAQV